MAVTAREVIMIFRGQNYLSSAVRRVSADVAGLSRMQQLSVNRAMAQGTATRAVLQQKALKAELDSVRAGGTRRLALERTILNNSRSIALTQSRIAGYASGDYATHQKNLSLLTNEYKRLSAGVKDYAKFEAEALALNAQRVKQGLQPLNIPSQQNLPIAMKAVADQAAGASAAMSKIQNDMRLDTMLLQAQLKGKDALIAKDIRLQALEGRLGEQLQMQAAEVELANIRLKQQQALIAAQPWVRMQQFGRTLEHAARVMQMFGLIAGATFGYMAKSAADFNTQMTVAATQTTVAGHNTVAQVLANAKQIGDAVQQLLIQGKTIAKPEELSQSIYDIFSGVTLQGNQRQQIQQGITLLKEFNQVVTANAGLVTMDEATQAGITLINDFNLKLSDMPKALNTMQAAVRYGRMTMSQFLSTFNQAAPAAKSAGYSFTQMADSITFLSRKFPSIRMAAVGYARLVEILGRSTKQFKEHGVTITDAQNRLLPLEVIVDKLAKRWPQLIKGGNVFFQNFFKTITGQAATYQARRAFVYVEQDRKGYHQLSQSVNRDNNELVKSLRSVEKSSGVTWAQFTNQLRAIMLEIGTKAIPAFQELGRPVVKLIEWFDKLDPRWKRLIGYWGSIISVGMVLVGVLGSVLGGVLAIGTGVIVWAKMHSAMRGVTDSLTMLALAQGNAGRAAQEMALSSEAGFIRVGTALKMGLGAGVLLALPLLIQYRREIGATLIQHDNLRQSVALLSVAFGAFKIGNLIQSFAKLSIAMKLITGAGGILAVGILFAEFSQSTDALRSGLDALFTSWVGYVATVGLMTVAVIKLKNAMIDLGIAQKALALSSAISGSFTRLTAARVGSEVAVNAGKNIGARGVLTNVPAIGGGVMVKEGTRYIGVYKGAITEATTRTARFTSAFRGFGAAVSSFGYSLAAGGVLMAGLYLWQRHLDIIHRRQEEVRKAQEYLDRVVGRKTLTDRFKQAGDRLENMWRRQIDYNRAVEALKEAKLSGNADDIKEAALNLSDAARALHAANVQFSGSQRAFTQFFGARNRVADLKKQQTELIQLIRFFQNPFGYTPNQRKNLGDLAKQLDVNSLWDVIVKLNRINQLIPGAEKSLNNANRLMDNYTRGFVNRLSNLGIIPSGLGARVVNNISAWLKKLARLGITPKITDIQMYVKVATKLDSSQWDRLPAKVQAMLRLLQSGRIKKLTRQQLDVMVKLVFGIDPNSTQGAQIEAMIKAYIASVMPDLAQVQDYFNKAAGLDINGTKLGPPIPTNLPKPTKETTTRTATPPRLTPGQIDAKNLAKIQQQTAELGRLYQKATLSKSAADWLAYNRLLTKYQKDWAGDNKANLRSVFDQMLQYQQDTVKEATQTGKTITTQTFQDILSGVRNMYDQFLQQEQSNFGQLFQGPVLTGPGADFAKQWGFGPVPKDVLRDQQAQMSRYNQFNRVLGQISKAGAPKELVKGLRQLGPEQLENMRNILRMKPADRAQYFANFEKIQREIKNRTMQDLKDQLAEYNKFGKSVAKAIIAGIQSEDKNVTAELTRLIKKMYPGLPIGETGAGGKDTHKTQSPPKNLTRDNNTPPKTTTPKPPAGKNPAVGERTTQSAGTTTINHYDTFHIGHDVSEDVSAKVRMAYFHAKNKYKR